MIKCIHMCTSDMHVVAYLCFVHKINNNMLKMCPWKISMNGLGPPKLQNFKYCFLKFWCMTNIFTIKDIMVGAFLSYYLYDNIILDLYYCSWLFACFCSQFWNQSSLANFNQATDLCQNTGEFNCSHNLWCQ